MEKSNNKNVLKKPQNCTPMKITDSTVNKTKKIEQSR